MLKAMSLRVLSEKTGIQAARLSRIFNGKEGMSELTIKRIASSLGMVPHEVYKQIELIRAEKQLQKEGKNL